MEYFCGFVCFERAGFFQIVHNIVVERVALRLQCHCVYQAFEM